MSFEQLGLSAELLRATNEQGYRQATPVQQQTIPLILERPGYPGRRPDRHRQNGLVCTLPLLQHLQVSAFRAGKRRRVRAY